MGNSIGTGISLSSQEEDEYTQIMELLQGVLGQYDRVVRSSALLSSMEENLVQEEVLRIYLQCNPAFVGVLRNALERFEQEEALVGLVGPKALEKVGDPHLFSQKIQKILGDEELSGEQRRAMLKALEEEEHQKQIDRQRKLQEVLDRRPSQMPGLKKVQNKDCLTTKALELMGDEVLDQTYQQHQKEKAQANTKVMAKMGDPFLFSSKLQQILGDMEMTPAQRKAMIKDLEDQERKRHLDHEKHLQEVLLRRPSAHPELRRLQNKEGLTEKAIKMMGDAQLKDEYEAMLGKKPAPLGQVHLTEKAVRVIGDENLDRQFQIEKLGKVNPKVLKTVGDGLLLPEKVMKTLGTEEMSSEQRRAMRKQEEIEAEQKEQEKRERFEELLKQRPEDRPDLRNIPTVKPISPKAFKVMGDEQLAHEALQQNLVASAPSGEQQTVQEAESPNDSKPRRVSVINMGLDEFVQQELAEQAATTIVNSSTKKLSFTNAKRRGSFQRSNSTIGFESKNGSTRIRSMTKEERMQYQMKLEHRANSSTNLLKDENKPTRAQTAHGGRRNRGSHKQTKAYKLLGDETAFDTKLKQRLGGAMTTEQVRAMRKAEEEEEALRKKKQREEFLQVLNARPSEEQLKVEDKSKVTRKVFQLQGETALLPDKLRKVVGDDLSATQRRKANDEKSSLSKRLSNISVRPKTAGSQPSGRGVVKSETDVPITPSSIMSNLKRSASKFFSLDDSANE